MRETLVHLLCLLQQGIYLLSQWGVMREVFCLLGAFKTRCGSKDKDNQEVVLLAYSIPFQSCQSTCPEEGHQKELQCHGRLNVP